MAIIGYPPILALLITLVSLAGCGGVASETLARAVAAIEAGAPVIDVRTEAEYARGHLPEAKLVPYARIDDHIGSLVPNKEQTVVLYCHSGRRSGIAAGTLRRMGYQDVINAGGLADLLTYRQQQREHP